MGGKVHGPRQCPWPVKDDETEAAMRKLGLAPSPTCSVRLICSYEEHLRLVRMAIVGAKSHLNIMSCYFFANEAPFVNVVKHLLPDAAKRGVRVRLSSTRFPRSPRWSRPNSGPRDQVRAGRQTATAVSRLLHRDAARGGQVVPSGSSASRSSRRRTRPTVTRSSPT